VNSTIRIGECQNVAFGLLRSEIPCCVGAGLRFMEDHGIALTSNRGTGVGGTIIHNNDFDQFRGIFHALDTQYRIP
jgi:hypothetical protein